MLQKMDSTGKQVAELLREFNSRSKAVLLHSVLYYFLKYYLVVHVVITLKLVIVHNRYYGKLSWNQLYMCLLCCFCLLETL